jgi:hypothetical protein
MRAARCSPQVDDKTRRFSAALRHTAAQSPLPGVTHGRKLVVLVGQEKAVAIAVKNVSGRRHWSALAEWLVDGGRRKPAFFR